MSSLRNAVKRKTHKERAQPSFRQKFGLLEKHKDYVLRARDFNKKKKRLQALQEKAAFRNKDEFYFKMEKTGTRDGIFTKVGDDALDADVLKLMKTQDLNYISLKSKTEDMKIEKLMSNLHSIAASKSLPKMNSHTVFLDSDEDEDEDYGNTLKLRSFEVKSGESSTEPSGHAKADSEPDPDVSQRLDRGREAQYRELVERMRRRDKLKNAAGHLEVQRNLMQKGRRYRKEPAEDGRPATYVWRAERKR